MYAVFQIGGFQYRGEEGTVLEIPRQKVSAGSTFDIPDVMLVKTTDSSLVGTPLVEGAHIEAEVLAHGKSDKVTVYKFKRRTKYRRTQGHRQGFTRIKLSKIHTP